GWFTHPALKTGNNKDDSGNFATLDLIKALEWIQNNIEEFGGDPNRITIAGQSAGCMNVWGLLQSPLADGKFHRAICSSGIPNAYPPATGYIQSGDLLNKLLIKDGYASNTIEAIAFAAQQSNTWIADYLRSQPVEELVTRAPSPVIFGHFTDGTVIRTGGYASLIAGNYNKVPLMLGSTKDEGTLFTSLLGFYKPDLVELWDMINNDPTNLEVSNIVKDEVYPFYAPLHETLSFALNLTIDNVMRYLRLIDGHLVSSDLYRYNMNWDSIPVPWKEVFGAAHGIDIPFFLGNFTTDEPSFVNFAWSESNRLQREALSAVMMTYFAEFMRTGNPNASGDGLPTWSDWSNFFIFNKRMIFDNNYHMSSYDFFNVDFMNLYNNLQVDQQALTNQMEEDYQLRLDDSDVSYQ
ncbi:carboxylesterase family protein, partial [bacterium]|nr:carboxylesterase family protein [bacterium]